MYTEQTPDPQEHTWKIITNITNTTINNNKGADTVKNVYVLILEKDKESAKIHCLRIINIQKVESNLILSYTVTKRACKL